MPIDRNSTGALASDMFIKLEHLLDSAAIISKGLPDTPAADVFATACASAHQAVIVADDLLAAAIAYEAAMPVPRSQKGTDAWYVLRAAIAKATGK